MSETSVREGELLWTPDDKAVDSAGVTRFLHWLAAERGRTFDDYDALWRWSIDDLEGFWAAIWDYFAIASSTPYQTVLSSRAMPGARWFVGSRVNYAEHVLRAETTTPDEVAIVHRSELRPMQEMTWRQLADQVRTLAVRLRELGIRPGDRVVAYMPNIPETAVAMLACTAIGAVWAAAAPEFGARTVIDRFAQIEPALLFVADGYRFAGKDFDRTTEIARIVDALPTLRHIVWLDYLEPNRCALESALRWQSLFDRPIAHQTFAFERVAEDHPLWVLFSSGTTGPPKGIVHSHVGIVAEILKSSLVTMVHPGRRMFFYTTTGWMMWNSIVSSLMTGTAIVLYDGHPAYPAPDLLWELAQESKATTFGASPTFVGIMQKAGVVPKDRIDVSRLRTIALTGSPVSPETTAWFYRNVKADLWVTSPSGGTEICAALVSGSPTLPVYAGEIQRRALGMDVHSWDATGHDVRDGIGELVVTSPSPSMPLSFWNDPDGRRYHEAYFDVYPGVWRHGDFLKINARGGCSIYGRSDATLNRFGVRIGTAEVYRILDTIPAVADSLVVCLEETGGAFFMPLFVKLAAGYVLDDRLRGEIAERLRREGSPRHVPDTIVAVDAIPYTLTGKKMEIPVRRILSGAPPAKVATAEAMIDPTALAFYARFAADRLSAAPMSPMLNSRAPAAILRPHLRSLPHPQGF